MSPTRARPPMVPTQAGGIIVSTPVLQRVRQNAEVYRAVDGLHLRLRLEGGGRSGPDLLVVELDPQHLGEETVAQDHATEPGPALTGRLSDRSRLVFELPDATSNPLGDSLEALLTLLRDLTMALPPQALTPVSLRSMRKPTAVETALELPYRLLLAPADDDLRWAHDTLPAELNGAVALWHSRLVHPRRGGTPSVRAVWSPDYPLPEKIPTGEASGPISPDQRTELVALTSEAGGTVEGTGQAYLPQPLFPQELTLTSLGGTLNVAGAFPVVRRMNHRTTKVASWSQRTQLGRDTFVEVVLSGRLAPFGHQASVTVLTERDPNWRGAILVTRVFLTVGEPVRRYVAGGTAAGRAFPFAEVEILTRTVELGGTQAPPPGLVASSDGPVFFDVRLTDRQGHRSSVSTQLAWADTGMAVSELAALYADVPKAQRTASLHGSSVVLADPPAGTPPQPHAVDRLRFGASSTLQPGTLVPQVEQVEVEVPGSAEFAGGRRSVQAAWTETYVENGPVGTVGAYLTRAIPDIAGSGSTTVVELFGKGAVASTAAAGGLLTPSLGVQGFAHDLGVIAGTGADPVRAVQFATGKLAATTGAKGTLAELLPKMKLLGALDLYDLIDDVDFAEGRNLPRLSRQAGPGGSQETTLTYEVTGDRAEQKSGIFLFHRESGFQLKIETQARTGGPNRVSASMHHFSVGFALGVGDLSLHLDRLSFTTDGAKPEFDLVFADQAVTVTNGPLEFVADLLALVPPEAFSDPPDVQILPEGVHAGYTLAVPPLQLGAFALSNLGFTAGFVLPFLGERPSLRIALSSRENPFGLLVACLGGAGFLAVEVDTGGVRQVEVSLEAQAGIALNLGVAKGKVLARLGIYLRCALTDKGTDVVLEGFVEISGAVCVLGIVTVSTTASLVLHYDTTVKKVTGVATVKVGVKVLFVKKTISFAIERSFSRSGADPSFNDVFTPVSFASYCQAFA